MDLLGLSSALTGLTDGEEINKTLQSIQPTTYISEPSMMHFDIQTIIYHLIQNNIPKSGELTTLLLSRFPGFDFYQGAYPATLHTLARTRYGNNVPEVITAILELCPEFAKDIYHYDFSVLVEVHTTSPVIEAYMTASQILGCVSYCLLGEDKLVRCGTFRIVKFEDVYYLLVDNHSSTEDDPLISPRPASIATPYPYPSWSTEATCGVRVAIIGATKVKCHPIITVEQADLVIAFTAPGKKSARSAFVQ
jgi:hypothetical protein